MRGSSQSRYGYYKRPIHAYSVLFQRFSLFTAFPDHIEGVSEKFKRLCLEAGYDASTWNPPVRLNNGAKQDLQVKAGQKILYDRYYALVGRCVQAVIQLSCAYFTPEWCGLSFEIIDGYCKEGEPKQEWVPTPLNECEEVELLSEHM